MALEFSNENVFDTLKRLVELKRYKDRYGKDEHYVVEQPLLWDKARCMVELGALIADIQNGIHDYENLLSEAIVKRAKKCTICSELFAPEKEHHNVCDDCFGIKHF